VSFSQVFLYIYMMDFFDALYLSAFQQIKKRKPKLAGRCAHLYVSIVQIALYLILGVFFMKFAKQMKLNVLDHTNLWIVSFGIIGLIFFKNWMSYTGKKRTIIASNHTKQHPTVSLLLIPFVLFILAFVLHKAA